MAGLLAHGSPPGADLPGFPVVTIGMDSPLTVAGAAADSKRRYVDATTAFPFIPMTGTIEA